MRENCEFERLKEESRVVFGGDSDVVTADKCHVAKPRRSVQLTYFFG
jgi:hypothetical protein